MFPREQISENSRSCLPTSTAKQIENKALPSSVVVEQVKDSRSCLPALTAKQIKDGGFYLPVVTMEYIEASNSTSLNNSGID